MTERRFFPPKRDHHTDTEWHEATEFLTRHELDPHNIPAGDQITWDDDARTITLNEWIRDQNGKLRVISGQVLARPVTIHATWSDLPTAWQREAL